MAGKWSLERRQALCPQPLKQTQSPGHRGHVSCTAHTPLGRVSLPITHNTWYGVGISVLNERVNV